MPTKSFLEVVQYSNIAILGQLYYTAAFNRFRNWQTKNVKLPPPGRSYSYTSRRLGLSAPPAGPLHWKISGDTGMSMLRVWPKRCIPLNSKQIYSYNISSMLKACSQSALRIPTGITAMGDTNLDAYMRWAQLKCKASCNW